MNSFVMTWLHTPEMICDFVNLSIEKGIKVKCVVEGKKYLMLDIEGLSEKGEIGKIIEKTEEYLQVGCYKGSVKFRYQ